MFILKKGHQPGVYVPLRALFLVVSFFISTTNELQLICVFVFAYAKSRFSHYEAQINLWQLQQGILSLIFIEGLLF